MTACYFVALLGIHQHKPTSENNKGNAMNPSTQSPHMQFLIENACTPHGNTIKYIYVFMAWQSSGRRCFWIANKCVHACKLINIHIYVKSYSFVYKHFIHSLQLFDCYYEIGGVFADIWDFI